MTLKVEQADREAAAALLRLCGHHLGATIAAGGEGDDNPLIQAFARHRTEAYQRGIEAAAKVAEMHMTNGKRMYGIKGKYDEAAEAIATAIRQLKDTP